MFLRSRGARLQCPFCGGKAWEGWDERIALDSGYVPLGRVESKAGDGGPVYLGEVASFNEAVPTNPRLRGVLHQAAFPVSLVVGLILIGLSEDARELASAAVFASSVAVCFGISALYHRGTWAPRKRLVLRRLDHAGVYLLIAGTYTPVYLLALEGVWRFAVLAIVSGAAGAAIVLILAWDTAPSSLTRRPRATSMPTQSRSAPEGEGMDTVVELQGVSAAEGPPAKGTPG